MSSDLNILKILWEAGIVVKLVLIVLAIASIASWALIFKKRKQLAKIEQLNDEFINLYNQQESLKEVRNSTENLESSSLKEMFVEGHDELMRMKGKNVGVEGLKNLKDHFTRFGLTSIERSLKKGSAKYQLIMDDYLSILASIGSVSPFIGLFGTVWGIINSFEGLSKGGAGATLDAVAPGIAEALVATAIGLVAAIPATWFYNIFLTRISRINTEMESFGEDFLNAVEFSLIGPIIDTDKD